jgi:hypothetical protein
MMHIAVFSLMMPWIMIGYTSNKGTFNEGVSTAQREKKLASWRRLLPEVQLSLLSKLQLALALL